MSPLRPGARSDRVRPRVDRPGLPEPVIWHDVECGSYTADLAVWERLTARCGGPALELGAGTGRVVLRLGGRGVAIGAVENDPELAAELKQRATAAGVGVAVDCVDACSMALATRYSTILAPMQFVQTIARARRPALLAAVASHLRPGGLFGAAIVEGAEPGAGKRVGNARAFVEKPASEGASAWSHPPAGLPMDVREVEGWLFSSRPLWVSADAGLLTVTRERERVSPAGEIERSIHRDILATIEAEQLESEMQATGLDPIERIALENGPGEADSVVIVAQLRSQPPADEGPARPAHDAESR